MGETEFTAYLVTECGSEGEVGKIIIPKDAITACGISDDAEVTVTVDNDKKRVILE